MWIFQEEIVPSPFFCWYRGEGDGTTVCDSLINKWGRCGLDETGIGWKTGCTVSKFVRNSQPEREVMANRDLSLLLLCLQFEGGTRLFYLMCSWEGLEQNRGQIYNSKGQEKQSAKKAMIWIPVVMLVSEGSGCRVSVETGKASWLCWKPGNPAAGRVLCCTSAPMGFGWRQSKGNCENNKRWLGCNLCRKAREDGKRHWGNAARP